MDERGAELMAQVQQHLHEAKTVFANAQNADLSRPCADEEEAGTGTIGEAAAQLAEGCTRLGRFLHATGYVADAPRVGPGHGDTEHLAARYTVVLYDRRGFSRSRLDGPQDPDRRLAVDADDVRRLILHCGGGPATVFGSSSGAIVALTALVNHPTDVGTVVAHEPPAVRHLPDGQRWLDLWRGVYEQYRESGVEPALAHFRAEAFPASDVRVMDNAPKNPVNATYWFEHELRQYPAVELDLDALATHADRIFFGAGRDSVGYPCRQVAAALADRLGRTVVELPGGHIGFVSTPAEFAVELLTALRRTGDATGRLR